MDTLPYRFRPIDPNVADALRAAGGPRSIAQQHPGYPCRQCLRDAEAGDELILVSHDPFSGTSPYRSSSPIFLHAEPCTPVDTSSEVPDQLLRRQLSVRSFDRDAMMIDAAIIDGSRLDETIRAMFSDPASSALHVHNATRGCWAVTVER